MTNLNLKKFQIVKDVVEREEFFKLCKPFVGYDKLLAAKVSRGETESIEVKLQVQNEENKTESYEIECLV